MVFDFLKRGAVEVVAEKKASATGPVVAVQTSGRVAWSPRDVVSLTRSGFCGNPVGFRSVKLIAEAAAALPLVLQDAAQRFEAHPLLDLVTRHLDVHKCREAFVDRVHPEAHCCMP